MMVSLQPESAVPLFEQLRSQLELLIVSGQLAPGARLPAIRHLATDLGLAKGTVAKVYDVLARDGLVQGSGRNGTVVAATPPTRAGTAALAEAAERLALMARQLGVPAQDVLDLVDQALTRQPAS